MERGKGEGGRKREFAGFDWVIFCNLDRRERTFVLLGSRSQGECWCEGEGESESVGVSVVSVCSRSVGVGSECWYS